MNFNVDFKLADKQDCIHFDLMCIDFSSAVKANQVNNEEPFKLQIFERSFVSCPLHTELPGLAPS